MADTLTQLIAKVQAQLLDAGTLFSTATLTTSARMALAQLNKRVPQNAAELITAVADQLTYELNDYDAQATGITAVLLQGANDDDSPLTFDGYVEDSRVFFRLRQAQPATSTLIAQYTKPHTISGLDSATESTLTDALNVILINGICAAACLTRAAYTVEANNIEPNASRNWLELATRYTDLFQRALDAYLRQPTAKAKPSTAAWNDAQHDTTYP